MTDPNISIDMGDSFLQTGDLYRFAGNEELMSTIDQSLNLKLAAGLKKSSALIFKKLSDLLQEKMKLMLNDHMEELFKSQIKQCIQTEVQAKMNEFVEYQAHEKKMYESISTRSNKIEELCSGSTERESFFDTPNSRNSVRLTAKARSGGCMTSYKTQKNGGNSGRF